MVDPECPATVYAPCSPLVTVDDLTCGCGLDLNTTSNADLFDLALIWASRRTMMASRYRFMGCCTASIRPMREPCDPYLLYNRMDGPSTANGHLFDEWGPWGFPTIPLQITSGPAPTFVNCWNHCCEDECDEGLPLPYLPVRDVLEVKIDGVVLDPDEYYVVPGSNMLVRKVGHWPDAQSKLPDTEVGTWSVTFRHGLDLPPEAKPLVANYACQLALRCAGQKCDLKDGITVVSRPGVEYALLDTEYRDKGLTGYQPLDDWLMQVFGGRSLTRPNLVMHRPRRTAVLQ